MHICIYTRLIFIDFYRHMFFMTEDKEEEVAANVDKFMDSYARDTTVNELKDVWHPGEIARNNHDFG